VCVCVCVCVCVYMYIYSTTVALIGSLVKKNRQTNVSHHKGDSQIRTLKKARPIKP
jgi:hypothetical protein